MGDKERALNHARAGTGRHPDSSPWILRLDLEFEIHGIHFARPLISEALVKMGTDGDASPIYQRGAELMAKANEIDDAIKLLETGIAVPGMTSLSSLYHSCAELMAKANRLDDAIKLLETGIAVPGMTSLSSLYQSCAELMAKVNRLDDAIKLLEKGIAVVPPAANLFSLYQSCAELMAKVNRLDDAIKLLEKGIAVVPPAANLFSLYHSCAELMAKANRLDDAIKLLEKGIAVPGMRSLYVLYQTAIEFAAKAGDHAKVDALVAKGLIVVSKVNGRHRIAETALRVFSGRRDHNAVRRLLDVTGGQQLDPPQQALADYLLTRLSGDWAKAVEVAHKGHTAFSDYSPLRVHEVDARLALGQVKEADNLMKDYGVGETQARDNPVVWLKAYVTLIAGRLDEAKNLAATYAPRDFDSGCQLDQAEMLRIWSVARNGMNGPIEHNFPGIAAYRQLNEPETLAAEKSPIGQTSKQPCVLTVATEWDSRHGGLSTFNRDLCAALAGAGSRVVCYVPQASADEVQRASAVGVEIVVAPKTAGTRDAALLLQHPILPIGFVPEVVIGHDRVTGAASVTLARDHFPGSKRVLFIHTSPEEIEWHKEPHDDSNPAGRAAERKRDQLDLAEGCSLIVAVGPRLAAEFHTDLRGAGNSAPFMELTPGLPECPATVGTVPLSVRCLVLGRVEDYQLKGLDLAARTLGRVVGSWKQGNAPKLVVRGAPIGTDAALRQRLNQDSAPTELDIVVRHYSADATEIHSDLREASLVLIPSKKEGFGLVGLEAIACGIPTLISDQSGLAETVRREAPQVANEWILPVMGDVVTKWEERIEFLLAAREGAFARAAVLRDQLAAKLDWKRAAAELLEKLAPNLPP